MSHLKNTFLSIFFLLGVTTIFAQIVQLDNEKSHLIVNGTSSLHDWHITAGILNGQVAFVIKNDTLLIIKTLQLSVKIQALKGEKKGMNNKIHTTLQVKEYESIVYELERITNQKVLSKDTFLLNTAGLLTIAGTTKPIEIQFTVSILKKKFNIKGHKELKMTDFNIKPPKAILGMLKTGDTVKVEFDLNYQ